MTADNWFSWISGHATCTVRLGDVVAIQEYPPPGPSQVLLRGGQQLAIGAEDAPKLKAALKTSEKQ